MHFRLRNRPSLASFSSRSRAISLASRFCRPDGIPLGLSAARAFSSTAMYARIRSAGSLSTSIRRSKWRVSLMMFLARSNSVSRMCSPPAQPASVPSAVAIFCRPAWWAVSRSRCCSPNRFGFAPWTLNRRNVARPVKKPISVQLLGENAAGVSDLLVGHARGGTVVVGGGGSAVTRPARPPVAHHPCGASPPRSPGASRHPVCPQARSFRVPNTAS